MRKIAVLLLLMTGCAYAAGGLSLFQVNGSGSGGGGGGSVVALQGGACNSESYMTTNTTFSLTGQTVSSGSNLLLTLEVAFDTGGATPAVVSAVWDVAGANQAMTGTNIPVTAGGTNSSIETWTLINPTPGASKTITIVIAPTGPVFLQSCVWTGVNQAGGATTFPSQNSAQSSMTVAVSSATGDAVLGGGTSGASITGVTGTTLYLDQAHGAIVNAFSNYDNSGSATVNIGSTSNNRMTVGTDIHHQ